MWHSNEQQPKNAKNRNNENSQSSNHNFDVVHGSNLKIQIIGNSHHLHYHAILRAAAMKISFSILLLILATGRVTKSTLLPDMSHKPMDTKRADPHEQRVGVREQNRVLNQLPDLNGDGVQNQNRIPNPKANRNQKQNPKIKTNRNRKKRRNRMAPLKNTKYLVITLNTRTNPMVLIHGSAQCTM